jgi:hypothetical protein
MRPEWMWELKNFQLGMNATISCDLNSVQKWGIQPTLNDKFSFSLGATISYHFK